MFVQYPRLSVSKVCHLKGCQASKTPVSEFRRLDRVAGTEVEQTKLGKMAKRGNDVV
jgi:hypothetical protein